MKSVENNAAQDGQLPLHYAAEKGVSLNVWKLLLEADPKAAQWSQIPLMEKKRG